MTESSDHTAGGEDDKKKGSRFKIRGFLTGKSRRKNKDGKNKSSSHSTNSNNNGASSSARAADSDSKSKQSDGDGDDHSTVYGVDVDDGSVDNANNPAALAAKKLLLSREEGGEDEEDADFFNENDADAKKYLLKVVLLLMDTKTRRFELLQLEFDSIKASVADVLSQIPVAVTEECLHDQEYNGITCADGQEKKETQILADFCKGGDVMVAVSSGATAAECAKLALPILSDSKVVAMLKASGIDASPWKEAKRLAKEKKAKAAAAAAALAASSEKGKRAPEAAPSTSEKKTKFGGASPQKENKVQNKSRALPESFLAAEAKKSANVKAGSSNTTTPVITFHPNNDAALYSESNKTTATGFRLTSTGSPRSAVSRSSSSSQGAMPKKLLIVLAVLALLGAAVAMWDAHLSAPIKVGQVLSPGMIRHKCGVKGVIPGLQSVMSTISSKYDCENFHLAVEEEQVTGYDKNNNVVWAILGTHRGRGKRVCDVGNSDKECMRGLHYTEDKHIVVSGTRITWVETFGGSSKNKKHQRDIHPWPFEEKPVARTWRKK